MMVIVSGTLMAVLNLLGAYEGLCYPNRARGRSLPDELIEEYGGADQSGNVNVSVRKAHAEQVLMQTFVSPVSDTATFVYSVDRR
jgi:hypothetical protein